MKIYIMRHGYADNNTPDFERRLTEAGKQKISKNLPLLKQHANILDYVISSPLKRAADTAKLIHNEFNVENELLYDKALEPGSTIEDILVLLNTLKPETVLLVGHAPDVSILALNLIKSDLLQLPFSPGSVAAVKINGELKLGTGELNLLLPME